MPTLPDTRRAVQTARAATAKTGAAATAVILASAVFATSGEVGAAARDAAATALVDIGVLDVATGEINDRWTVVWEGDVITAVGPSASTAVPQGATRVEGRGRIVMPGLIDGHVHADSSDFGLFLANGVTSVRELNGSADHLRWREEIAAGRRIGPRLLVSSPLLAGEPIRFRHEEISSPEEGTRRVRALAAEGFDLVKIYDGLSPETYRAIVAAANEEGLPLTGHVPAEVGLAGVLQAGQSIEHAEKIVMDVLGHDLADPERLAQAADAIARAGVAVTPTLAVHEALASRDEPTYGRRLESPEMAYVDAGTLGWWRSLATVGGASPGAGDPWAVRFLRAQRDLVARLAARDVPLLAGTDTPNPLMVPGFGLHDEIGALVRAGLSPLDAIRSATATSGAALDFGLPVGRVEPGYAADLLVISGDPLADPGVLRSPDAVVHGGRWLGRSALDALLADRLELLRRP